MKVFLDDKRPTPPEYDTRVETAQDAIACLKTGKVTEISLDHDLGDEPQVGNGYHVAQYIEQAAFFGKLPRVIWHIHSDNAVGRQNMERALCNADRFWDQQGI